MSDSRAFIAGPVKVELPPDFPAAEACRNCTEPIRRVQPGDGIDPRDYEWVHLDGNPLCDMDPPYAAPRL